MSYSPRAISLRLRGFTMVELLVGMLIAMIATIVIMQVFQVFEGQKRTTTGGADAQTNGSIALYNLQRDMASAGYGSPVFSTRNPSLMCEPIPTFDHDNNAATAEAGIFPILLADGGVGAGASDSVTVTYGDTQQGGVPVAITIAANVGVVANNLGCKVNDIALIINRTSCDLEKVTALTGTTGITFSGSPTVTSGMVACLGAWNEITYSITNDTLTRNQAPNVAGIVAIQAQYGISPAPNNNTINQWVDPTGDWELLKAGTVLTKPSMVNRNRIKAIRVAIVAQNGLREKDQVSSACSSTTTPNPSGVCAWEGNETSPAPVIDLTHIADWDHYRYRVFDVFVPVLNVIWSKDSLPSS